MSTRAARLEVVAGNARGMSILVEDDLLIGRHAEGAGRLAEDEEISRTHARVTLDASGICAIEDVGSTNGTFVNGSRISAPQALSVGDTIELGQTTLVVRDLPASAGQDPTDPDATPAALQPTLVPLAERAIPGEPSEIETDPAAASAPVTLSMHLEVDFVAREARLFLDEASQPVRLAFDAGVWHAIAAPNDEGDPE